MSTSRIIENQRRIALRLISAIERRMTPGRPFIPLLRAELAEYPQFGARDRRLYRELIFTWLRYRDWFEQLRDFNAQAALDLVIAFAADTPETLPLQSALGIPGGWSNRDWPEVSERLREMFPKNTFDPASLLPAWFRSHCPGLFEKQEILVQLRRAPLWLRAQQGSSDAIVQDFAKDRIDAFASRAVPGALRIHGHADLEEHPMVVNGRIEIQDVGSQALLVMARPGAGEKWFDFCAGAGGKSLQLARLLGRKGSVVAHDVRREALVELKRRVQRAGLLNIVIEPALPDSALTQFDGVLVDAPCSASGTWRRHPFLRHQTTPKTIAQYARQQADLLRRAAPFVQPNGRLVYATCSLSHSENEAVVTKFVEEDRSFTVEKLKPVGDLKAAPAGWITVMPSILDSDGYFVASLRRRE